MPIAKVEDLCPSSHGNDLLLKVVKIDVVLEKSNKEGKTMSRVVEALVGDETGCIVLTAKNGIG